MIKKFWKILEENEKLLNLFTAIVCFGIIGVTGFICWLLG